VTVFPGDEIAGMPPRVAGSGRIFPDDGDPYPDPETPGARFLEGEAEHGVAYVRAAGDRTEELEVIFPPGSLFREIEDFRLRVGDRSVKGRVFERVDPEDVVDDADEAVGRAGARSGDEPVGVSSLDEAAAGTRRADADAGDGDRISRDEVVTASELPESRVTRRADEPDDVTPVPAPSSGADADSPSRVRAPSGGTTSGSSSSGSQSPDAVVDASEAMEELLREQSSQPTTGAESSSGPAVSTPDDVSVAEPTESTMRPTSTDRGTPTDPSRGVPSERSRGTPTEPSRGSPTEPTRATPTEPSRGTPIETPSITIPGLPEQPPRRFNLPDPEADDSVRVRYEGQLAKRFGGEVATAESVRTEDIETIEDIEFTGRFTEDVDTDPSVDTIDVIDDPDAEQLEAIEQEIDLDLYSPR
jgi:hypothetical protein